MEFKLVRTYGTDYDTLGYLMVDGKEFCKTLEDAVRDRKIKEQTCIPYGEYKVKMTYSPKYKKDMPLIYNDEKTQGVVSKNGDSWAGIRIHGGNSNLDTEGCLLVAKNQYKNTKFGDKKNVDGTPIMNYISESMAEDVRALFKDKSVHSLSIVHVDSLKKETLYKLRNPFMKDDNIILIQKALNGKGYKLTTDGWFGNDTDIAIKDFQKKNGLTPDGIVGNATLNKLNIKL